jgi:hypothetical protein
MVLSFDSLAFVSASPAFIPPPADADGANDDNNNDENIETKQDDDAAGPKDGAGGGDDASVEDDVEEVLHEVIDDEEKSDDDDEGEKSDDDDNYAPEGVVAKAIASHRIPAVQKQRMSSVLNLHTNGLDAPKHNLLHKVFLERCSLFFCGFLLLRCRSRNMASPPDRISDPDVRIFQEGLGIGECKVVVLCHQKELNALSSVNIHNVDLMVKHVTLRSMFGLTQQEAG